MEKVQCFTIKYDYRPRFIKYVPFITLKKLLSIASYAESFYHKRVLSFVKKTKWLLIYLKRTTHTV